MAHVGYIRVNADDRHTERQLGGIALDRTFEDKAGGGNAGRPALMECFARLREGDVLHVHSIDRLARNLADLQKIVAECVDKGVEIRFHKENLAFPAAVNENPDRCRTLMFQMLDAFADFERSLLRERQRAGLTAARKRGKVLGRPHIITPEKEQMIWDRLRAGQPVAEVAKEFGIGRSSVYNIRRKMLDAGKS